MGAAIGGAVDGGTGAGIGAAAGAVAGVAGVLLTPGRPTVMPPKRCSPSVLQEPITINTEHSSMAYQPVNQQDYASAAPQLQQRPVAPRIPARAPCIPTPTPRILTLAYGRTGADGASIPSCRLLAIMAADTAGATAATGIEISARRYRRLVL